MSLTPLLVAPLAIQIHATAAIAAMLLGALVLFRRKGTPLHKAMGRLFVLLMLVETVVGMAAFGQTLDAQIATLLGVAGLIGLGGQVMFALLPLIQISRHAR